jgi:hypothetical protein
MLEVSQPVTGFLRRCLGAWNIGQALSFSCEARTPWSKIMSDPTSSPGPIPTPVPQESPAEAQATVANSPAQIAHGNRHDVHNEPDPDQLTRAVHTLKPAVLPAQEYTGPASKGLQQTPMQDVAVLQDEPSVWEALPSDDDQEREDHRD